MTELFILFQSYDKTFQFFHLFITCSYLAWWGKLYIELIFVKVSNWWGTRLMKSSRMTKIHHIFFFFWPSFSDFLMWSTSIDLKKVLSGKGCEVIIPGKKIFCNCISEFLFWYLYNGQNVEFLLRYFSNHSFRHEESRL